MTCSLCFSLCLSSCSGAHRHSFEGVLGTPYLVVEGELRSTGTPSLLRRLLTPSILTHPPLTLNESLNHTRNRPHPKQLAPNLTRCGFSASGCMCVRARVHKHTHTHTLTHSLTHSLTLSLSLTHTHTCTHMHTHAHTLTLTPTHTQTRTQTQTHAAG